MKVAGKRKLNQTLSIPILDAVLYWQSSNTLNLGKYQELSFISEVVSLTFWEK